MAMLPYRFSKYFRTIFKERIGFELTEDISAQILATLNTMTPHRKYDSKGRKSEYFTFLLEEKLVSIVCDGNTHVIITCMIETHHPAEFYMK